MPYKSSFRSREMTKSKTILQRLRHQLSHGGDTGSVRCLLQQQLAKMGCRCEQEERNTDSLRAIHTYLHNGNICLNSGEISIQFIFSGRRGGTSQTLSEREKRTGLCRLVKFIWFTILMLGVLITRVLYFAQRPSKHARNDSILCGKQVSFQNSREFKASLPSEARLRPLPNPRPTL